MENAGEMAVVPHQFGLIVARDPKVVLAEAQRAAKALKDIIEAKPKDKKVMMNGEQYLELEDWQLCAKFYGVVAKIVSTQYVEIGGARGFEAVAAAFDTATGQEVSRAESLCLNDEEKWSTRSKYEWKDGKKEKVGDVPVPLFQLKSMAQTRAASKVLRNVLAWVVVLAGYKPTPAEDMTGDETQERREAPAPIADPKPKEPAQPSGDHISDAQRKRFYAIWKGAGKDEATVKAKLKEVIGSENSAEIPKDKYESLCLWAEAKV